MVFVCKFLVVSGISGGSASTEMAAEIGGTPLRCYGVLSKQLERHNTLLPTPTRARTQGDGNPSSAALIMIFSQKFDILMMQDRNAHSLSIFHYGWVNLQCQTKINIFLNRQKRSWGNERGSVKLGSPDWYAADMSWRIWIYSMSSVASVRDWSPNVRSDTEQMRVVTLQQHTEEWNQTTHWPNQIFW